MAESKEKLFDQFPPVSTQEWKEKVVADLKGADFDKKLVWRTNEGFNVNPMYRAEDLSLIHIFCFVLPLPAKRAATPLCVAPGVTLDARDSCI